MSNAVVILVDSHRMPDGFKLGEHQLQQLARKLVPGATSCEFRSHPEWEKIEQVATLQAAIHREGATAVIGVFPESWQWFLCRHSGVAVIEPFYPVLDQGFWGVRFVREQLTKEPLF
jgi:hypothetical protein